jgi:3-hydroxyacyl-CoA dehydrogenase
MPGCKNHRQVVAEDTGVATSEQLTKWSAEVLALIDAGVDDVDTIIKKRSGARMSTLMALRQLEACKTITRAGNTVWRTGKRQFFGSPF